MNITFLTYGFGFPNGLSSSQHTRLITKGLVEAGDHVHVIIPMCTEKVEQAINWDTQGQIDGVSFEYTTGSPIISSKRYVRLYRRLLEEWATPFKLLDRYRQGKLDCVIYYGHLHSMLRKYSWLCHLIHVPFIVIMVEWPLALEQLSMFEKKNYTSFCEDVFLWADAMILISRFLEDRAREKFPYRKIPLPIIRFPVLMDPSVWRNIKGFEADKSYILYCADLRNYLQDTLFVVTAFSKIEIANLMLLIVAGKAPDQNVRIVHDAATKLGCAHRIIIRSDYVPTNELRNLYAGAKTLLAPMHKDDRSVARFPFKIADYLMSGRPVVSCKVESIMEYLQDGENAYLSEPDDVDAFTEKILESLTSKRRESVAQAGRVIAEASFNYQTRTKLLHNFLESVVTSSE